MDWDEDIANSPAKNESQKWVARKVYSEKQVTYILGKGNRG